MQNALSSKLQRPNWITSSQKQVAIIIRDASGSMYDDDKYLDALKACQELVAELAIPENKDGFIIGVVDFSDEAITCHSLQKASELQKHISPIQLVGGTNITAGLEKGLELLTALENNQEASHYLRPVVLLFTDGGHNDLELPHESANRLKEIADLVTVAFGSDANNDLLQELASTEQHFYACKNGRDLRQFMASVGKTMTMTFASKQDTTNQLTQLQ